ncbi:MAG: hypothetical protein AB1521_06025 [Bacteroidota bacterium]
MKNKTGKINGFVLGVAGFLLVFKFIFLDNIPPEDEIASGLVVIASLMNGLLFAFIGNLIQNYFGERKK